MLLLKELTAARGVSGNENEIRALLRRLCEERGATCAVDRMGNLIAHKDGCVGMAANMIGISKRIIAIDNDGEYMVMFNPEIIKKNQPYEQKKFICSVNRLVFYRAYPRTIVMESIRKWIDKTQLLIWNPSFD